MMLFLKYLFDDCLQILIFEDDLIQTSLLAAFLWSVFKLTPTFV